MKAAGRNTLSDAFGTIAFFSLAAASAVALSCYLAGGTPYGKPRSDFLLMTAQCTLGLISTFLPAVAEKKWHFPLPALFRALYYAFLFCAVFLGEALSFYYLVPHWDTLLHFFSGVMLGMLGYTFLRLPPFSALSRSRLCAALFVFSFSLAAGAIWEIYEYLMDGLLHMNMQKFADAQAVVYLGRQALKDTMKDLITDALAALATAFVCLFFPRRAQHLH